MGWGALRAAFTFLTRVPVGARVCTERELSWAAAWFPVVGLLLGALGWSVQALLRPLGSGSATLFAIAATVYVTGAFHEDGLADTADALGGAVGRERALEILKDSRIGSYGTMALLLATGLRWSLLSQNASSPWPWLLSGSLARVAPVWLMVYLPHAAPEGSKHKDLLRVPRSRAWLATALVLPLLGACAMWTHDPARVFAAVGAVVLAALWFARLARLRLGGIAGDLLGALEQVGELLILACFAWGGR